ncbi:ribosomal protein S6 [Cryptococcus amylolentus CBS 6039]|uniref:Ribosomal protein S6 n=4 Tax=Cryptococcus TaxID=5206 RepID=A0A1E3HR54_9TREE|nr:ribosomal protein S6 [Cryptococcus amylolentus CBS 6039]XP_019030325.1 ribosomal protein S6 [Cryptococcus wingfieldii CBS 7118]ODO06704.1 ribosomal protein S6 [Cryptococcus amylolentus CBS 6273]TYJ52593.1 ribosomal protein S6 [Cryptococcus floricola]ODN78807.1 ribosomal protein S6 [Cryptococcus amylolentus CBS 6039]ODN92698.1 ribosomal protein S6 [Cryptococcus wingfieldii CBS 7118]
MPLYELFCIAVHNPVSSVNLRGIVNTVSTQVHQSGGVVRDLKNMGLNLTLPQRIRRMRQYYTKGDHFTMAFDTSPIVLKRINETLRSDPSIIKWTVLKRAQKVKDLAAPRNPSIEFQEIGVADKHTPF